MLVWIFQTGEPLHSDGEFARPMRAMNLANALISNGDEVVIWSSNFFHQKMKHRFKKKKSITFRKNLKINLIDSIGYKNHIGVKRMIDHAQLGLNLFKELHSYKGKLPDRVFIGYPPIEFALAASFWCKKNKIPYILDIKDLWPDIYLEPIPKPLKRLAKIILSPYFIMASWTCRNASLISTITKDYLNWIYGFAGIKPRKKDFIFPLTTVKNKDKKENIFISKSEMNLINKIMNNKIKNIKIILFTGSFIEDLDIEPLIYAAERALKENKNWIFVLCGDGPKWQEVNKRIGQFNNTYLPGWITSYAIQKISRIPSIGIVLFRNVPNYTLSISNKTYEYLSLGIPIFSSLKGTLNKFIAKNNIGVNFDCYENKSLYYSLDNYFRDSSKYKVQSDNAKNLYKNQFEGNLVYQIAINKLKEL
tara:strand:- start:3445 stop:4704 length:1260 start_codon:yes stop_codon:yes gene_type:complete